jgi:hypothetical protein
MKINGRTEDCIPDFLLTLSHTNHTDMKHPLLAALASGLQIKIGVSTESLMQKVIFEQVVQGSFFSGSQIKSIIATEPRTN